MPTRNQYRLSKLKCALKFGGHRHGDVHAAPHNDSLHQPLTIHRIPEQLIAFNVRNKVHIASCVLLATFRLLIFGKMSAHTGSILCLNCLSFASSPDKNRDEEHATIIESLKAAKEMGAPSGAIVLQDYPWATAQGLDLLVKSLNEATGDAWEALRQWGSSQDENDECLADAVVLFDTAIYSLSGGVDKDSIGAFRDTDDLLAGVQDEIKAQLAGFVGRWAAAELSVVDASPPLAFLLVSYHGRGTLHVNGEFIPVQTAVKAAMSKDFIAQVADQIAERDHVPGLIAGCW